MCVIDCSCSTSCVSDCRARCSSISSRTFCSRIRIFCTPAAARSRWLRRICSSAGKAFRLCERNPCSIDGERVRVPLASWALDGQGILANAVSRLYDSGQTPTAQPCVSGRQRGEVWLSRTGPARGHLEQGCAASVASSICCRSSIAQKIGSRREATRRRSPDAKHCHMASGCRCSVAS